jgi:hypothetical protein
MPYLWHESLSTWAEDTNLHIDAIGLVTILGAEEINISVGRLVPSSFFDAFPLLGAFMIAGDRFAEKQPGFAMYNASAGIVTTELAAWFSRWLKSQPLYQVRSTVTWEVEEPSKRHVVLPLIGSALVAFPFHGMLIAMTVLSEDWWGFTNAMAMERRDWPASAVRRLMVGLVHDDFHEGPGRKGREGSALC